jgi:hypothetical protein
MKGKAKTGFQTCIHIISLIANYTHSKMKAQVIRPSFLNHAKCVSQQQILEPVKYSADLHVQIFVVLMIRAQNKYSHGFAKG